MFILHIALQGCLRAKDVEYGVTADTGGHIRYLLDLVNASRRHPAIDRIEIVTRAFRDGVLSQCYDEVAEFVDPATRIVRLRGANPGYLCKEQLWTEHDALVDALTRHIETLDRWPDVIHAHYADAGALAAEVGSRLGIPYVFTAHSLGKVKSAAFAGKGRELTGLDRRVAIEDRAIRDAAAIIASSRDEAELQYPLYDSYDPGRARIIAPGSDLAAFANATSDPRVDAMLDRFLDDSDRPAILAIARPVTKKNLAGLVEAYGRSSELQARANLVIVAGAREDLRTLEPEIADNLTELLVLIDRYDLYGKVAYPKAHRPADVPAIYAYARARRGLFVNPALNEPFGLTLLEAAASGLPVVATDSGGPNDIVETCSNGILVDPRDPDAIASAMLTILRDPALWSRYAAAGRVAMRTYDWDAHVATYVDLLAEVMAAALPMPFERTTPARQLLVSDIDGTLLGSETGLDAFRTWHGREPDLAFAVATGRSFHSALSILAQQKAPLPQIVIASVGSEIYHRRPGGIYERDADWDRVIASGWDRDAIHDLIAREASLMPQSQLEQRRFKLSYMVKDDPDAAERLRALVDANGLACTIIHSHGRYLDVLPFAASKGTAVEHVRQHLGMHARDVIVAGDSGNDIEMLRSAPNAIIVGNHSDGLAEHRDLRRCYVARGHHAHGILEGVAHFRGEAVGA
jgi:sucrose-phosphate synthase